MPLGVVSSLARVFPRHFGGAGTPSCHTVISDISRLVSPSQAERAGQAESGALTHPRASSLTVWASGLATVPHTAPHSLSRLVMDPEHPSAMSTVKSSIEAVLPSPVASDCLLVLAGAHGRVRMGGCAWAGYCVCLGTAQPQGLGEVPPV